MLLLLFPSLVIAIPTHAPPRFPLSVKAKASCIYWLRRLYFSLCSPILCLTSHPAAHQPLCSQLPLDVHQAKAHLPASTTGRVISLETQHPYYHSLAMKHAETQGFLFTLNAYSLPWLSQPSMWPRPTLLISSPKLYSITLHIVQTNEAKFIKLIFPCFLCSYDAISSVYLLKICFPGSISNEIFINFFPDLMKELASEYPIAPYLYL